jgi:hypothetical protein
VLGLVDLVAGSGESTRRAVGNAVVSGNVALGLLLVGLLGCLSGLALDGFGDVVGGVLDGVDGLADDALVGCVGVGGRHVDVRGVGWFGLGGKW